MKIKEILYTVLLTRRKCTVFDNLTLPFKDINQKESIRQKRI